MSRSNFAAGVAPGKVEGVIIELRAQLVAHLVLVGRHAGLERLRLGRREFCRALAQLTVQVFELIVKAPDLLAQIAALVVAERELGVQLVVCLPGALEVILQLRDVLIGREQLLIERVISGLTRRELALQQRDGCLRPIELALQARVHRGASFQLAAQRPCATSR